MDFFPLGQVRGLSRNVEIFGPAIRGPLRGRVAAEQLLLDGRRRKSLRRTRDNFQSDRRTSAMISAKIVP